MSNRVLRERQKKTGKTDARFLPKPAESWGTDRPLAVAGLTSYRYKGRFGWVMIGARDHADALVQAERSIDGKAVMAHLEVWNGTVYVPAT